MKHILFPTAAAADAFIADLQSRGAIQPEVGSGQINRAGAAMTDLSTANMDASVPMTTPGITTPGMVTPDGMVAPGTEMPGSSAATDLPGTETGGTAEDAGAGAVKGTIAGLLSGAVVGVVGTAAAIGATVATGGLAVPVILGMAALGSGVGAAVGGIGGASGVDEVGDRRTEDEVGDRRTEGATSHDHQFDDERYERVSSGLASGGRAVAVDDYVQQDVLEEVMKAHDGHYV